MLYSPITLKTPCPKCNGLVTRQDYDSDCRGNPASLAIRCENCDRSFSFDEWSKIEAAYALNHKPKKKKKRKG